METSIIAAAGLIVAALVALFGVIYGHLSHRIDRLENQLYAERAYSREMWSYTRRLLDLYYRHRQPGAPDPGPLPEEPDA